MKSNIIIILFIIAFIIVTSSVYTVYQNQQAILVQLGKPVGGVKLPGLHFKIPIIQNVIYFEKRLLTYDAEAREIITKDKKTLVVDNYAKWKIIDPLKFYQSFPGKIIEAQSRLDDIVYSVLRKELGIYTLTEIVSKYRSDIMDKVKKESDEQTRTFGIEIVDVRIKRADLPQQNEKHVFGRMQTEREREAKHYRSEGEEEALKIRAEADKEKTIIMATAYSESEAIRGLGDAQAISIYAEAYKKDPEFFRFLRSIEAYKNSLYDKNMLILTPDLDFLRYFDLKEGEEKINE